MNEEIEAFLGLDESPEEMEGFALALTNSKGKKKSDEKRRKAKEAK